MNVKTMLAAAATVAFAAPAFADNHAMAAYFGNTAEVTYADGSVVGWHFDEEGAVSNTNGAEGSWSMEGNDLCLTMGEAEEASCASVGEDVRSVGDTFAITLSDGSEASVTIVEGRE